MTTLRIPAGFVRGENRSAVPGRYSDGNLIRWQNGTLKPVGGWERQTQFPLASVPRMGFVWQDDKFDRYQATICDGNVYARQSEAFFEITPADWRNSEEAQTARGAGSGLYGVGLFGSDSETRGGSAGEAAEGNDRARTAYPVSYSMEKWGQGELLFCSSADGRVMVWNPDTPTDTPLVCANAPTFNQAIIVTDEQHLMTFGGAGFPNRVAWSDQGNREGWNYVNVEGQSGYFDLQDAGLIYCARKIPGGYLIFTQTSVWVCRYIGYPNFYGFTKLADAVAPISPQSVIIGSNRAFWWGTQSFHKYEGGVVAPVPCDLGTSPFEDADEYFSPKRITGGYNGNYPEIWWFYPSKGQNFGTVENDRYVVFNFVEGWWTDGYLQRSFFVSSAIDKYPIAGSKEGHVYMHERGFKAEGNPRAGDVWAEVATLSFEDGERVYSVTQAQVDGGTSPENVRFEFDCRMARGGENLPTEYFYPRPDGYMDARFSAKDFTMRVVSMVDGLFGINGLTFDVKPRGKR